jgi:anti-sigma factor RsiW
MGRELTHEEVQDLLGAYALDAVDGDDRHAVERHLEGCTPCRTEVADHREVAGLLAAGWVPAPEGVWDRIASALEESPPSMQPPVPLGAARERRRERSRGPVRAAVAVAAAVAIGAVAFLGVKVIDTNEQVDNVAQQLTGEDLTRVAEAAARRPDARQVALRSADRRLAAEAVLLPDGTGYLVKSNLPSLSPDRTYQLWAVMGGAKISVGVLGTSAGPVAFHASGEVSALAITEEVAGGVIASVKDPTVLGTVA